jgi:ribosomal protein S27E
VTRHAVAARLVRDVFHHGVSVSKFFTAMKRTVQSMGEAPDGERYSVAGRAVQCGHCRHDRFVEGRAQLNTAGMTFLNLDWANRSAATLTCTGCGRIEWFLSDPEEIG